LTYEAYFVARRFKIFKNVAYVKRGRYVSEFVAVSLLNLRSIKQSVFTRHFIIVIKKLHVSAVRESHHQASRLLFCNVQGHRKRWTGFETL